MKGGARQRMYIDTKGKKQHKPKGELEDGRYRRNKSKERKKTRKSSTNVQRRSDDAIKKIRNCKKLKELFDLQCHASINHFQISFYWNQAARFMSKKSEFQKVQNNPGIFRPLVKQTLAFSSELRNPQSLAVIVQALAKISFRTRKRFIFGELWEVLEGNIVEATKSETFNSWNCANILWAFAKTNRKSDQLFRLMEKQVLFRIDDFNSQNMTNIVWAYARVGHSSPKIFDAISFKATGMLDTFNAQAIANTVWAYAKLRQPSPKLFHAILPKVIEKLDDFNSQNIANTVWAYAKVGHSSPKLFDAISQKAMEKLDDFNSQEIANTVWAYATVRHFSPKLFDAISHKAMKKLNAFNPQDIANTVWAYATVGHLCPKLFDAISYKAMEKLDTFTSQNIANTVWAFATAGHSSPKLFDSISHKAMKKLYSFNSQEIANTVWAYATVGHFSPKLFDAISHKAMEKLDSFNSQNIANTVWAFATVGHSSPKLFDAIWHKAVEKLDTFNSQNIANTVWGFATIGYKIDSIKLDVFVSKVKLMLEEFKIQDIISLLWSLAVLDFENVDATDPFFSKITEGYNSPINNEDDGRKLSTEDLSELHQVSLWYNEEHEKISLLPPKLREESKLAFIACESRPSNLQKDVLKTFESLESLGLAIVGEEIHCNQTGYSLDIVIRMENSKKEIAVEIDGPSHFIKYFPKGATTLKRRQLNRLADRALLSIPYWEWNKLSYKSNRNDQQSIKGVKKDNTSCERKKKECYLRECLQEASFL